MRRTFQDLACRAAVDGLVQRSICGHLTEEMTERYSSVAQRSGGKADHDSNHRRRITVASTCYELAFRERDIGVEPTTFSLGRTRLPSQGLAAFINRAKINAFCQG
jgi:hypothetical protein